MKAVLLISHGSRYQKTIDEVRSLVEVLKKKSGLKIFEFAFLELQQPSIPEGIDLCVGKGATEIVVLLNFLNAGRHVDHDIPAIVADAQKKYPKVEIRISQPVGQHQKIADLFLDLL